MRVVHLVTRLNIGGVTRHLAAFLPYLQCDFLVAAGVCLDEPEGTVPFEVVRLPHLARPLNPLRDSLAFVEILSLLRRLKPDILHTHMAKAGWLGRLAARIEGVRCVHTYHGNIFTGHFGYVMRTLFGALERATVRLLNGAVYVSPSTREAITAYVGCPRNVCVIPTPFTPLEVSSKMDGRETLGFEDGGIVVGWVGRMVRVKRPDLAVDAVAKVADCHLVMVGDGPLRRKVEKLAEKIAPDRVRFLGWVPPEEIGRFVCGFDLLLITSVTEGYPIALVEALYAGVPVVAVEAEGVVDVMGADAGEGINFCDAGIVCKEEFLPGALRQAISHLEEMRGRVGAAWRRVWEVSNPEVVADAHMRFYRKVLMGRRRSG